MKHLKNIILTEKVIKPEVLSKFEIRLKDYSNYVTTDYFNTLFKEKIWHFIFYDVTITYDKKKANNLNLLYFLLSCKNNNINSFLKQYNSEFYKGIFLNENGLRELFNTLNNIDTSKFKPYSDLYENLGRNGIIIATHMYHFRNEKNNILATKHLVEDVMLEEIKKMISGEISNVKKDENIEENKSSLSLIFPKSVEKINSNFIFNNNNRSIFNNNNLILGNNNFKPIFNNNNNNNNNNNMSAFSCYNNNMSAFSCYNNMSAFSCYNNNMSAFKPFSCYYNNNMNAFSNFYNNINYEVYKEVYEEGCIKVGDVEYKKVMNPGNGNCLLNCCINKFQEKDFGFYYINENVIATEQLENAANDLRSKLKKKFNDLKSTNKNLKQMVEKDLTLLEDELSKNYAFLSTDALRIISNYYNREILLRIYQIETISNKAYIQYKKFTPDCEEINIEEKDFNNPDSWKISYSVSLKGDKPLSNGHYAILEKQN